MSRYLDGTDVLGAGDQAIVIRVKNIADVVKSQGGSAGALAFAAAPQTITNKVYGEMRAKLADGLRQQGVDADVSVVSSAPSGSAPGHDLYTGIAIGAGGIGVGALLWYGLKLLFRRGQ